MLRKWKAQGIVEYILIAVIIAVVIIAIGNMLGLSGVFPAQTVAGRVTRTYTLSCATCVNGYAVVHQVNGQDVVIELRPSDYGLVNVGDTCTFSVSLSVARSFHCTPTER